MKTYTVCHYKGNDKSYEDLNQAIVYAYLASAYLDADVWIQDHWGDPVVYLHRGSGELQWINAGKDHEY